jgi:hypothetical protein
MTTKLEIIEQLKSEYPTLKIGDDQTGYTDLSPHDYEKQIEQWAENQYRDATEQEKSEADKLAAKEKLAALGLTADDLKALGL